MPSRPLPDALVRAAVLPLAEGTDADLLGAFITASDPAAFAELVRRHGPMVLGVCRRALGDTPDADDAFQAVWLVLIRKARSISPRGKVGNWLYGVAARTAAHLRAKTTRRRVTQELPDVPDPRTPDPDAAEVVAAVDVELARLPDKYRAAVVLCELESRSLQDAADTLGVPLGTVASRLARGRALLAERLKARGFAASVLTAVLAGATAPVSARLNELAVALLTTGPQEVARSVSEVTHGVLATMLAEKLKAIGWVACVLAFAVGAVVWIASAGAQPMPADKPQPIEPWQHGANKMNSVIPRAAQEQVVWDDLYRDEPYASRAVIELAGSPKTAIKVFTEKGRLRPLKADKEQIKKWIADLGSDKEAVWKDAYRELDYFDPILALTPSEAWAEAKTHPAKHRLAALMTGKPEVMGVPDPVRPEANDMTLVLRDRQYKVVIQQWPFPEPLDAPTRMGRGAFKETHEYPVATRVEDVRRPAWTRATRAVVILESIRSPEALALLKEMAAGHPDAAPTLTAKEAVRRLTAPAP